MLMGFNPSRDSGDDLAFFEIIVHKLVSTLLEIQPRRSPEEEEYEAFLFQPFLRFWGLCVGFLWFFKFFFGFLQVRRSA
jgi:hypothetical protein